MNVGPVVRSPGCSKCCRRVFVDGIFPSTGPRASGSVPPGLAASRSHIDQRAAGCVGLVWYSNYEPATCSRLWYGCRGRVVQAVTPSLALPSSS